jgi:small subunit ribosomal protein S13
VIRLIGVDLPNKKRIAYALTSIHGIGIQSAKILVESANIDDTIKTEDLSIEQTVALKQVLDACELKLEGDLRRFNALNIKRLNEINCFRGQRHRNSLPVRGQRSRTNARTRRGAKKTVSSKKK